LTCSELIQMPYFGVNFSAISLRSPDLYLIAR